MEKEALLIYLKDVRDLELAQYLIAQRNKERPLSPWGTKKVGAALMAMAGAYGVLAVVGAALGMGLGALALLFGACLWAMSAGYWQLSGESAGQTEKLAPLALESQVLGQLLVQAYDVNLLPQPYRNLAAVHYIYTYMVQEGATLEEAFRQERLENGMKRTERQLTAIFSQRGRKILNDRKREINDPVLEKEEKRLLREAMSRTPLAGMSEDYARIAANHGRINEYFRNR